MRRIALMVFRLFFKAFYYFYHICKCASRDDISYEEGFRWIKRTTILANRAGRVKIDAHGMENLPEKDGFIMFPNHQGLFDVLVFLESCPRPFAFVIKKEAANIILLKQVREALGSLVMDREDIRQSMKVIQTMAEEVKKEETSLSFRKEQEAGREIRHWNLRAEPSKAQSKPDAPLFPVLLSIPLFRLMRKAFARSPFTSII